MGFALHSVRRVSDGGSELGECPDHMQEGLSENQGVLKCCWILPELCIFSLPTGAGRVGRTCRLSNLGEWSLMGEMKKVHPPLSETGVEEKGGEIPKLLHLVTAEH